MGFPSDLLARFSDPVELGRGGMGTVYQVSELATGHSVAIKVIEAVISADAEMRERFELEVRLAGKVQSAHVVRVFSSGETASAQLYMVTELVIGSSLRRILDAKKQLPAPKVIGIGRALLSGLGAIHDAGIIHRDIKPGNLMVDRQGSLKIIDFGIARDTADKIQRTRTGTLMGSPSYLSPEQVNGDPTLPATDVYAAGVILYEALAGRPPFTGENLFAILNAHLTETPAPIESLVPDVPKAFARVIHRMLAREPARRYRDGREALGALKAATGDRGSAARAVDSSDGGDPGASLVPGRLTAMKMPALPRPTRAVRAAGAPSLAPPAKRPGLWIGAAGVALILIALMGWVLMR